MTRPKPRERLEKTLARVAREQGLDQERLRRWVSFLALCGALDRAIHTGILAGYYLKGGVAMELRFADVRRRIIRQNSVQTRQRYLQLDVALSVHRLRAHVMENRLYIGYQHAPQFLEGLPAVTGLMPDAQIP
jgi:hypothetical protein